MARSVDAQLRDARTAYVAAARRLDFALQRFDGSGMPMDPGPDPDNPLPWSVEQRTIIRAVALAFREACQRRDEWDGLRRDVRGYR